MNIGVFTTLKVRNGIPLFFNRHRERLVTQANKLNLGKVDISYKTLQNYLQENNLNDCALKIIITKQRDQTTITLHHRIVPLPTVTYNLITVSDKRNYRKIYKTTDRASNDQAKKLAEENGANDALFTIEGIIIESTIANVFSLNKNGDIITPPIKARGLNGITRQLIMEHTNVIESDIHQNTKGPLVLVNALRLQKVTHLNGKKLIDGQKLLEKLKIIIESNEKDYLLNH